MTGKTSYTPQHSMLPLWHEKDIVEKEAALEIALQDIHAYASASNTRLPETALDKDAVMSLYSQMLGWRKC